MKVLVCENYESLSRKAAQIIGSQLILNPDSVLGLATGSTPIGLYEELIKMYNNKELSFSKAKSFNLDEYYKLPIDNDQSYHYFMDQYLFNHVDINRENVHLPNGMADDIDAECINYEKSIDNAGGIDIQVLGIGSNGHIGFNEPTIDFKSKTHVVELEESTRIANSRFFNSLDEVPTKAITMGTGSIFKSRKILLLASGSSKAEAIYNTIHGKVTPEVPSSILQFHKDVIMIIDKDAAKLLNKEDYDVVESITTIA